MDAATFKKLAEALTGTPVKGLTDRDEAFLATTLADDNKQIDCSQMNELLLLVNKDRMEPPFFDCFFQVGCRVSGIAAGVGRFQQLAMLRYGNFIFAYRTLSRLRTEDELRLELGECARPTDELLTSFKGRSAKLINIELIEREHTPLVGYLSAGEIVAERGRAKHLHDRLPAPEQLPAADWGAYEAAIVSGVNPDEQRPLQTIVANYRAANTGATVAQFADYLSGIVPQLEAKVVLLNDVRAKAVRNQDIYLT